MVEKPARQKDLERARRREMDEIAGMVGGWGVGNRVFVKESNQTAKKTKI